MFFAYFVLQKNQVTCVPVPGSCSKCSSDFKLCKTNVKDSIDFRICLAAKDKCLISLGCPAKRAALISKLERRFHRFTKRLLQSINGQN